MSIATGKKFACEGCQRSYGWKPELAGRKVKCKCGQVMKVPEAEAEVEPELDDLYALAPKGEIDESQPYQQIAVPVAQVAAATSAGPASPMLAYQRGPTARDKQLVDSIVDPKRDYFVPVALLIVGLGLYVGFYGVKYGLGGNGLAMTALGICLMTTLKAALLFGFALVIAGPVGVSFGGIGSAALKLAAIAVFVDGVTIWISSLIGSFGFWAVGFAITAVLYWGLLTYLFNMDAGDSMFVVMLLTAFDTIMRIALVLVLLKLVLSFGGVSGGVLPGAGGGGGGGGGASNAAFTEEIDRVEALKDSNALIEGKKYTDDGKKTTARPAIDGWYAAGAKNVWFEVTRDINGRGDATGIIVELPKAKGLRKECFAVYKEYLKTLGYGSDSDETEFKDDGAPYLMAPVPGSSSGRK